MYLSSNHFNSKIIRQLTEKFMSEKRFSFPHNELVEKKENRPEVICHMVSTIEGKIAGQSFAEEGLRPYLEFYVQTKQKFETQATVYGASTAKEIFVGKDMEAFARPSQITDDPDYICGQHAPYFVVAIDPLGEIP